LIQKSLALSSLSQSLLITYWNMSSPRLPPSHNMLDFWRWMYRLILSSQRLLGQHSA